MAEKAVIQSIREKISKLMTDNRQLREGNVKLSAQRDKLKADNRQLAEKIAELEKRINVLELKEGFAGGENNKYARARVNRLMREVDKCIALLNR